MRFPLSWQVCRAFHWSFQVSNRGRSTLCWPEMDRDGQCAAAQQGQGLLQTLDEQKFAGWARDSKSTPEVQSNYVKLLCRSDAVTQTGTRLRKLFDFHVESLDDLTSSFTFCVLQCSRGQPQELIPSWSMPMTSDSAPHQPTALGTAAKKLGLVLLCHASSPQVQLGIYLGGDIWSFPASSSSSSLLQSPPSSHQQHQHQHHHHHHLTITITTVIDSDRLTVDIFWLQKWLGSKSEAASVMSWISLATSCSGVCHRGRNRAMVF